jgi:DMSO/TMAO reductase YedYZ molybdopterin-dependent catalytic subunit
MIYRLLLLGLLAAPPVLGQDLTITRDHAEATTVHPGDWSAFRRIDIQEKDKDGQNHVFSGVAVSDLLQKAGVAMGPQLRGKNMAQYVVVTAADNYKVVFALPELDSVFTDRTVLLVDRMDGKPLPEGRGPYRIIVPGEKKPARWIYEVRSLSVHFAKDE